MFTGIIEEMGTIKRIDISEDSGFVTIDANKVLKGTKTGDSIAVNGVCLTVTSLTASAFTADVMAQTIRQTALNSLSSGSRVNLERAMAADGRFGGHIVAGHVEGVGEVEKLWKEGNATWVSIKAAPEILRYVVARGSIAIDGMSLTVAYVDENSFRVSVIPHTAQETTILNHGPGDLVNLETDIIARYIEKLMQKKDDTKTGKSHGITMEELISQGF